MTDKKIGISIFTLQHLYGDKRALEIAKEIGADAVDFDLICNDFAKPENIYSKGDLAVEAYYADIKAYADSLGLIISQTHGRINGFRGDEEFNKTVIENGRLDLLATSTLGAPVCVMHTVTTCRMGKDADPKVMHELNLRQFKELLPYAAKYNVMLATETFGDAPSLGCIDFFGDIDEFLKGYEGITAASEHRDYFCVCMDTGHTNKASRFGTLKPAEAIRKIGGRIKVLHLNDNDSMTDQHKTPMTGNIDWQDTLSALEEIGYTGVYNMELNLDHFGKGFEIENAAFSVKVMRHLLNSRENNN